MMAIFWPYPFTSSWQFTIWLLITVYNDTCMRDIKSVIRQKRRGKKAGGVKEEHISLNHLQIYFPADIKCSPAKNMTSRHKALNSSKFSYAECTHILKIFSCWMYEWQQKFASHINELLTVFTTYSKLIVKRLMNSFWILCKRQGNDFRFTRCKQFISTTCPMLPWQWIYIHPFMDEYGYHN